MSRDNHTAKRQLKWEMVTKEKTKNYYSAHNFATRVIFSTKASLHDGDHDGVDGTLLAFPESVVITWHMHYLKWM